VIPSEMMSEHEGRRGKGFVEKLDVAAAHDGSIAGHCLVQDSLLESSQLPGVTLSAIKRDISELMDPVKKDPMMDY
jgi:hypothetical protein